MKKLVTVALNLFIALSIKAQNYPSEWHAYTSDGYFHAVESGVNDQKLPEERFRDDLLNLARTNLAKQIEVKIDEVSQMSKDVVNGNANIHYESQRTSYTDVDMKFAESKSHADIVSGKQYVIVYINKVNACRYYENEAKLLIGEIDNKLKIAENYSNTGFKSKAKNELDNALVSFDDAAEIFFWLNVYGMPDYQMEQYRNRLNQQEQTVKQNIADLEYGTTYCVVCNADNFGRKYDKLTNEIKSDLSESGCNFVDNPNTADFVIYIDASSREYNIYVKENYTAYFSYVDATIAIDKIATNQRIYEGEVSVKGSHTLNYDEAGSDGYKKIRKEITKMLKENIKL